MQISEKYANEYETIRRLKQIYQSPEFEKDYMYEGSDLGARKDPAWLFLYSVEPCSRVCKASFVS